MTRYIGNDKETVTRNKAVMEGKLKVGDSFTLKGKVYRRVDARKLDGKKWILEKGVPSTTGKGKVIAGKTKRTLINVTSRTHFDELLKSYPNVIIDFTAKRCGPCQQLKPILKRLNSEIDGIQIIMVDVDKHEPISDNCAGNILTKLLPEFLRCFFTTSNQRYCIHVDGFPLWRTTTTIPISTY